MDSGGEDDAGAIGDQVGVVLAQLAAEVDVDAEPPQLGLEVGDRPPVVLLAGHEPRPAELPAELLARLVEMDLAAERRQRPRRLQPAGPPPITTYRPPPVRSQFSALSADFCELVGRDGKSTS